MISILADSSVVIAGIGSPTGASHLILELARKKKITVYTTSIILSEVIRNLKKKFPPQKATQFLQFLAKSNFSKIEFLSEKEVLEYSGITAKKDIHIVAAAYKGKVEYLVSLDKKHILSLRSKKLPFSIVTPSEFLMQISTIF